MRKRADGSEEVVEENPDLPYDGAKIISSQEPVLTERSSGLNTTRFILQAVEAHASAIRFSIQLWCNQTAVFWCQ